MPTLLRPARPACTECSATRRSNEPPQPQAFAQRNGVPAATARSARALACRHCLYQRPRHLFSSFAVCSTAIAGPIVHWEIRPKMEESDVEAMVSNELASNIPGSPSRITSATTDLSSLLRDFKEFIRICGMTHVRTSPYYPQSNGKIERWHRSIKSECIQLREHLFPWTIPFAWLRAMCGTTTKCGSIVQSAM